MMYMASSSLVPTETISSCLPVEMAGAAKTATTAAAAYIGRGRCISITDPMRMVSTLKTGMPIGGSPGVTTANLSVP